MATVAGVLGAVVESRAVGAERSGNENTTVRKLGDHGTGQRDGTEQSGIGTLRREANLRVARPRDLVAAGGDALRACLNVGAMNGGDFFRLVFEYVCGP